MPKLREFIKPPFGLEYFSVVTKGYVNESRSNHKLSRLGLSTKQESSMRFVDTPMAKSAVFVFVDCRFVPTDESGLVILSTGVIFLKVHSVFLDFILNYALCGPQ
jgi:hypothetical protein